MYDFLLSLGVVVGVVSKLYALRDESTVWSRRSSGFNLLFYPFTALYPFYMLELYWTFLSTFATFLIWMGIYVFRAPPGEDWLGRRE